MRKFVSRIFSEEFQKTSALQYYEFLRHEIGFEPPIAFSIQGIPHWAGLASHSDTGHLKSIVVAKGTAVPWEQCGGEESCQQVEPNIRNTPYLLHPDGALFRYLSRGTIVSTKDFEVNFWPSGGNCSNDDCYFSIERSTDGKVLSVAPQLHGSVALLDNHRKPQWIRMWLAPKAGEEKIEFYSNGMPKGGLSVNPFANESTLISAVFSEPIPSRRLDGQALPNSKGNESATSEFFGEIDLWPNGNLRCAQSYIDSGTSNHLLSYRNSAGEWEETKVGSKICFDEKGLMTSATEDTVSPF